MAYLIGDPDAPPSQEGTPGWMSHGTGIEDPYSPPLRRLSSTRQSGWGVKGRRGKQVHFGTEYHQLPTQSKVHADRVRDNPDSTRPGDLTRRGHRAILNENSPRLKRLVLLRYQKLQL
jgi:hypothetical protein